MFRFLGGKGGGSEESQEESRCGKEEEWVIDPEQSTVREEDEDLRVVDEVSAIE